MKNLKRKVVKKLAARPTLGTFYIINDAIYYSTINHGIDHSKFWQMLVPKLFPTLVYENKRELMNAPYGVERGRVTWTGELDVNDNPKGKGQYVIYGTPGSKPFEKKLMSLFNLSALPEEKVKTDFSTDGHYKIQKNDKSIFDHSLKMVGDKAKFETTHFADAKVGSKLYEQIQKVIASLSF
jgi:hypothetical protein